MNFSGNNRVVDLIFSNIRMAFLFFLFLVVFGTFSLSHMQRQGFPDVAINMATVTVIYPNAPSHIVESEVVKPLEAVFADMDSVKEYQTISSESAGVGIVTFFENSDLDSAISDLDKRIALVSFPEDAMEPKVSKISVADSGQFMIGLSGPSNDWGLFELSKDVQEDLENLDGVKSVRITNAVTPEVVIAFVDSALTEKQVTRAQVEQIIQIAQFEAPVGSFEDGGEKTTIILSKTVDSLDAIRNIVIAPDVVLGDVATVTPVLNNNDTYNRIGFRDNEFSDFKTQRAVVYSIVIDSDADIVEIEETIQSYMNDLKSDTTKNGELVMLYNQAFETRTQIQEISSSLFGQPIDALGPFAFLGYVLGGLGFVVLLLFIFMNARIALLAAMSIPLSLFSASMYLYLMDIQLNTLVLFSMVLVIGLVVDPTIVFLESLQRYKLQGLSGREAAAKTMSTVGLGVFLAVATNIIVFLPFGVVGGFFGQIIKYIPATVIPAMIASMLIPVLFFMPLGSYILSGKKNGALGANDELEGTWFVSKKLGQGIKFLLGRGKSRMALRIFVFLLTFLSPIIVGVATIKSGAVEVVQFAGEEDAYQIIVNGEIPDSVSFETAVYEYVVPMQNILAKQPEILHYVYYQQNGNSFTILGELLPIDVREENGMRSTSVFVSELNAELKDISPDALIEASTSSAGPPSDAFPIKLQFAGHDAEELNRAATDIETFLSGLEGIRRVENSATVDDANTTITVALDPSHPFGQNPMFVYSVLKDRMTRKDLGKIALADESFDVFSVSADAPKTLEEVQTIKLGVLPTGQKLMDVTINDVVSETTTMTSINIQRLNGKRYVQVSATVGEDVIISDIQSKLDDYVTDEKLAEYGLDRDAISSNGEMDMIADSFTDLFIALAVALFIIYVLLVAFFRSFVEPFIILFAVPLGLVGVFLSIAFTTGQLGFLELLGVVTMAGIVVNVTILLIDYANQLKREGKSVSESIAISVAVRFRPIVLTQLTAFGSLIPLVFLSPFWKGLAAAIIFGIISSALLSLFVTPILYLWSDTLGRAVGSGFQRIREVYGRMTSRKQTITVKTF